MAIINLSSFFYSFDIYIENGFIMKKQLIRLTEGDLHKIINESVKKILNEMGSNTTTSYATVDVGDIIDAGNEVLCDWFETECPIDAPNEISIKFEYEIIPYDGGDYYTPPEGGYAEIHNYEMDGDDTYKAIMPTEIYQLFVSEVNSYVDSNLERFEEKFYEDYENYEPDYDDWRDDDY